MSTPSNALQGVESNRLVLTESQPRMLAVVTTGIGSYDRLEYRQVPLPSPAPGEVLLQVLAAGVNNTDINTRIGWYASLAGSSGIAPEAAADGHDDKRATGWSGTTPFPLIQGTDCSARVVSVATDGEECAVGTRVLVRPCMRLPGAASTDSVWMGADFDGTFAQFVKVPATEVFPVRCDWSDAELGSIPCAYGTAENMLQRARLAAGERVLITGASGGVGTAALQLAKRRGAVVTAVAGFSKLEALRRLGADLAIERSAEVLASLSENSVDLVVDNVAGSAFPQLLRVLRRGGRYVTSGAIAGPMVSLDMRTLYLKDQILIGCTAWDEGVFQNLISYIEHGEIRPVVARIYPLAQIADAQREFLEKKHVGKFVLMPPPLTARI
ncbi:MAG TPA: alcohol dehydrogenase family protein, partial [Steroidobacteraceae bacterium]|nr:alcohol dehydrogenase family protein [Steroidobacteraceae bacterium]